MVHPARCDVTVDTMPPQNNVTVVDPGFFRPIQWATLPAGKVRCGAEELVRDSSRSHLTEREWMEQSGREERTSAEKTRRQKNIAYATSLDRLSKTRRRCSDEVQFASYCQMALQTLEARANELVCVARSLFRWRFERRLQSFLDRTADLYADPAYIVRASKLA